MSRLAIILCFIPRVISGTYTTVQHETYSEHISRQSRSNLPTQNDYVYRQFDKPGERSAIEQPTVDPYAVNDHFGSLSFGQGASKSQTPYSEVMRPYTTPSTLLGSKIDYAIAKSVSDAGYESSKFKADTMLDKLKSLMHYHPPPDVLNSMPGHDGINDYHMDDDDIRSSRSLYDNWPYFYHSPYEYEHNKDIYDTLKAKDKHYVADRPEGIIPVTEIIENDYPQTYERTAKFTRDVTDNPIRGNGPFFSFVLNDYFDRNGDEDPVIFKGLDFGDDFDHETYVPVTDERIRSSQIRKNKIYTTVSPVTVHRDHNHQNLLESESLRDRNIKQEHAFDKRENGANKNSEHSTGYENHTKRYNGFKDFLDTFANKFGSEDIKNNLNIIKSLNQDKGENKKGFRRVYHKDEYQEDKEFYDNKNSSLKGLEKGGYNGHVGGSEAYLHSHAAAAVGNETKAASNAGNTNDAKYENTHQGNDRVNMLENRLDRYRDVAKEAAQKNNDEYVDTYKVYGK